MGDTKHEPVNTEEGAAEAEGEPSNPAKDMLANCCKGVGAIWIAWGIFSIGLQTPGSWLDPLKGLQMLNDHIAYLTYVRLLVASLEVSYGGFMLVSAWYGSVGLMRNASIVNLVAGISRFILMLMKTIPAASAAGLSNYMASLYIDLGLLGVVSCLISLAAVASAPSEDDSNGVQLHYPMTPKVILALLGVAYCAHFFYYCLFKEDWIVEEAFTLNSREMPMSPNADFEGAIKVWLSLLACGYLVMFHAFIMLQIAEGAEFVAMCVRATWTWSAINVMVWLAVKVFLETMRFPVFYVNIEFILSLAFAAIANVCSLITERAAKPEYYFRNSSVSA